MNISHRLVLHFPPEITDKPIIYSLVRDFNLVFNILKASITPSEEGLMVIELKGEETNYQQGIEYLSGLGVKIQPLSQEIKRNDTRCTHCGACIIFCPPKALHIADRSTFIVSFEEEKCNVCGVCIRACPVRAMEVLF